MSALLSGLTERSKQTLAILVRSRAPVTCSALANELDISDRTVRKELAALKSWALDHSMRLVTRPRVGAYMESGGNQQRILNELSSRPSSHDIGPASRVSRILWLLLFSDAPLSHQAMSARFFISANTLRKDLTKVRLWLDSRCIELISSCTGGLLVQCSEWRRRMALCEVAQATWSDEYASARGAVELVLQDLQKRGDIVLSGSVYYGVVCYLSIASLRIKQGRLIETDGLSWATQLKEHGGLSAAIGMLDKRLGLPSSESESIAACAYIMSLSSERPVEAEPERLPRIPARPEAVETGEIAVGSSPLKLDGRGAAEILAILVGNAIGADLLSDRAFIDDFGTHLTLAFSRMASGTSTHNPFKANLKKMYPRLYDCTEMACRRIERLTGLGFSDDELAYAVMYIGAAFERHSRRLFTCLIVCASGMGVAKFLSERLMSAFPSIRVRALVSVSQLMPALEEFPVDLVISPVRIAPLAGLEEKILVVDPTLPAEGRALIAARLAEERPAESSGREAGGSGDPAGESVAATPINVSRRAMTHARLICERVAETFKWTVDPLMMKALGIHLQFARQRLRRGQVLSQPVSDFEVRYPRLFAEVKAVLAAVNPFQCEVIPDEEVVPIVVYFASSRVLPHERGDCGPLLSVDSLQKKKEG